MGSLLYYTRGATETTTERQELDRIRAATVPSEISEIKAIPHLAGTSTVPGSYVYRPAMGVETPRDGYATALKVAQLTQKNVRVTVLDQDYGVVTPSATMDDLKKVYETALAAPPPPRAKPRLPEPM